MTRIPTAWGPAPVGGLRPAPPGRRRRAFTLIELLLVIAIIGVLVAVVVPQFGAGMSGARLSTAARTVVQAGRYARTMALLHQAETELVLTDGGRRLVVEAAPLGGENRVDLGGADGEPGAVADSEGDAPPAPAATPEPGDPDAAPPVTNRPAAVVTASAFGDEVRAEFAFDGLRVRFVGYTDSEEEGDEPLATTLATPSATAGAEGAVDEPELRVRYRSNGTCRPHRFRVQSDDGLDAIEVAVDLTGGATVIAGGEETP